MPNPTVIYMYNNMFKLNQNNVPLKTIPNTHVPLVYVPCTNSISFYSFCRWNHGRFRDLYNVSDGVREDTAPARRAVGGTEAVHGPGQLCVSDSQGLWSEGSIQGTQCPTLRVYS